MKLLARAMIALSALLPLACSAAEAPPKYQLGRDYKAVRTVQPTSDPDKIEVMEVFAYSCPHCFQFEPALSAWLDKKPADVNFLRIPHTLGSEANELRNRAMFTAHLMGQFDKFHRALFGAIHGGGKLMSNAAELRTLFTTATGVPAADYDGVYKSFPIDGRARAAEQAIEQMGITSVPGMIVEGRYWVSPRAGGGSKEMLAITDFLVEQARKERKKSR